MQTNGLTERFNQTLSRCLGKVVDDSQDDWDLKIDTVLMGYRASKQASTKLSPYYILYQQEMRLPVDNDVSPWVDRDIASSPIEVSEVVDSLLQSRERAFQRVEQNIQHAQMVQKETYDRKHQQTSLPVGTKVLLENTKEKQRKGGKLEPLFTGPYLIHCDLGKGVYKLSTLEGKVIKQKANINRIKLYFTREDQNVGLHS